MIFQTMIVKIKQSSLKYQRFTPSGCKDIGIQKFNFECLNIGPGLITRIQNVMINVIQGGCKLQIRVVIISLSACTDTFQLRKLRKSQFQWWINVLDSSLRSTVLIKMRITMTTLTYYYILFNIFTMLLLEDRQTPATGWLDDVIRQIDTCYRLVR